MTPDEIFAAVQELTERLAGAPAGSPEAEALQAELDTLRSLAADQALDGRHDSSLVLELKELRRRLRALNDQTVQPPSFSKRRFRLTDPTAFARQLNERLEKNNAGDKAYLEGRISELERELRSRRVDPV